MSKRSNYCSANSTDFLTSHPDAMHQDQFDRKSTNFVSILFALLIIYTVTLSVSSERIVNGNCESSKIIGRQHARDYLSFRNALSVIKRIINGTRFYEKACAHWSNKCYADTFINHGKSFDKLLS